jgi:hypothetical protein
MTIDTSVAITPDYLRTKTHADLLETDDQRGTQYVEQFLTDALDVVIAFLSDHEKTIETVPTALFDPNVSGVKYDPYHREGEVLLFGGPRGMLQGGYRYLSHRDYLTQPTLLTILSKGLLHAYNQSLVTDRFESHGRAARLSDAYHVQLYDEYKMLVPAVDEGITQMFSLYLEGDIADTTLRNGYIDAWSRWYQDTDVDSELFEAVAYTVSDHIEDADGANRQRIVAGLKIQEPLIRDGDVGVIGEYLNAAGL